MEGTQEMVQVMKILFDFGGIMIPFAFKATGAVTNNTLKALAFLGEKGIVRPVSTVTTAAIDSHDLKSGMSLKRLIKKRGENIGFLRIPEDKIEEVKAALQNRRCFYSVIQDLNPHDGKTEIAFHLTDANKVNSMIEALGIGELISFNDYIENADPEFINNQIKDVKQEQHEKKVDSPEQSKDVRDFENNNKKANKNIVTINKESLLYSESETSYTTIIPGTKKEEYITFSKTDGTVKETDEGKTIAVSLGKDKQYNVTDKSGNLIRSTTGEELKKYYDNVSRKIKEYNVKSKGHNRKKAVNKSSSGSVVNGMTISELEKALTNKF